ncbi:hypothetical protein [Streptomyces sp. NPDC091219]|uniref:hypothetical protein n=1 Tax=Streptomyces sp. NPDC091219 TaxID=3155193 RepID=UPI00344BF992
MTLAGPTRVQAVEAGRAQVTARTPATGIVQAQDPTRDIPDLALVVSGGTGRTETWRSGQSSFARLWALLQPTYTGTEQVSDAWEAGRYPAVRITVVWGLTGVGGWPLTHRAPGGDVAVEREDQLFVASDGTPWVRTDPAPEVADDDIRWHRAPRPVFAQWERAGSLGEAGGPGSANGAGAGWTGPAGPVWWAAAGVAVGAGGTLLIRRAAARREAGPPRGEPRQELIDL